MPTYSVRFRHPSGADVGPFTFSGGSSIAVLKERLLQEWPAGGRARGGRGAGGHLLRWQPGTVRAVLRRPHAWPGGCCCRWACGQGAAWQPVGDPADQLRQVPRQQHHPAE